jgi:hypothetical protein
MKHLLALVISATLSSTVLAETAPAPQATDSKITIDTSKLYVGFGLNHNRIDQSSFGGSDLKANGFQLFAGYEYGNKKGFDIMAEAGVIKSKDFSQTNQDADGIWVAGVVKKDLPEINNKLAALVRIGYGINGDDGLLMGFGAQLRLHPKAVVRLEYLNKDLTQSYQVNAVYQF